MEQADSEDAGVAVADDDEDGLGDPDVCDATRDDGAADYSGSEDDRDNWDLPHSGVDNEEAGSDSDDEQ